MHIHIHTLTITSFVTAKTISAKLLQKKKDGKKEEKKANPRRINWCIQHSNSNNKIITEKQKKMKRSDALIIRTRIFPLIRVTSCHIERKICGIPPTLHNMAI